MVSDLSNGDYGVKLVKHVLGVAPGSAPYETLFAACVEAPFADIPRHVERAATAEALMLSDGRGTAITEIAQRQNLGAAPIVGGLEPVKDRGKALSGKFRKGRRFVPADPGNGVISLSLRKSPQLPIRRTGLSRGILEFLQGLCKGDGFPIFDEFMLPKPGS